MDVIEIDKINDKLRKIDSERFQEVYDYLNLLEEGNDKFVLSDNQKRVLDLRRKTPIAEFISKAEFIKRVEEKYGV
jgi:hypothetical protein